jgi:hypothetical protein
MNKTIKYTIWALILSILLSGFFLVKQALADQVTQEMIEMSHQYNRVFANLLIKKIVKLQKGDLIMLYLKDGNVVVGEFKGYNKSDEAVWLLENGHFFQTGYGVMELEDVRLLIREPV